MAAFGKEGALDVPGRGGAPVISGRSGSSERAAMAFLIPIASLKRDDHVEVSGKRWVWENARNVSAKCSSRESGEEVLDEGRREPLS